MPLRRRTLLIAGAALGLGGAAAVVAFRREQASTRRAGEIRADYLAGRVTIVGGWIMSHTEAATLPIAPPASPP